MTLGPDDIRRLRIYPVLAVGLVAASVTLIKTGRDAVYFQSGGVYSLPMVYLGIAMTSAPFAMAHLAVIRRLGTRRSRIVMLLLGAAVVAGFLPWVEPGHPVMMAILFVMVPVVFEAAFASTWLLTSNLFEKAPQTVLARIYTSVALGAALGSVGGGMLARALARETSPRTLVALGTGFLVAATLVAWKAHGQAIAPRGTTPVPTTQGNMTAQ